MLGFLIRKGLCLGLRSLAQKGWWAGWAVPGWPKPMVLWWRGRKGRGRGQLLIDGMANTDADVQRDNVPYRFLAAIAAMVSFFVGILEGGVFLCLECGGQRCRTAMHVLGCLQSCGSPCKRLQAAAGPFAVLCEGCLGPGPSSWLEGKLVHSPQRLPVLQPHKAAYKFFVSGPTCPSSVSQRGWCYLSL